MKTLAEMTTAELQTEKFYVDSCIRVVGREAQRAERDETIRELANFRNAIDDELWSRGA